MFSDILKPNEDTKWLKVKNHQYLEFKYIYYFLQNVFFLFHYITIIAFNISNDGEIGVKTLHILISHHTHTQINE